MYRKNLSNPLPLKYSIVSWTRKQSITQQMGLRFVQIANLAKSNLQNQWLSEWPWTAPVSPHCTESMVAANQPITISAFLSDTTIQRGSDSEDWIRWMWWDYGCCSVWTSGKYYYFWIEISWCDGKKKKLICWIIL